MTPMIDVVFLLIVFFLVSSHLAKNESRLPLPLPDAVSGQSPAEQQTAVVTINVLGDGQIFLAGKLLPIDQLQPRLEKDFSEQSPELQVRIRGDRHVPYRSIESVLLACARTGIWNVQVAVVQPSQSTP